jgi:hypothetical protein
MVAACPVPGEAGSFEDIAPHGRRKRDRLGTLLARHPRRDRRQGGAALVRPRRGRSSPYLASACAAASGIVPARRATETKGGEPAVLPELLDGLDLRGRQASPDALACRR